MLTRARTLTGAWGVGLLAVSLLIARPSAQDPAPLFDEGAPLDARLIDSGGPSILRARVARVRLERLTSAAAALSAGDRSPLLALNLFDDLILAAELERLESDGFGHQTWVGHVAGDPLSTVTLTWKGNVLSGGVSSGDALYRISAPDGTATIEQLDPGSFPIELPPLLPPAAERVQLAADAVMRPAAGEVVDMFVYYTAAAKTAAGGQAAIEALIAQGIADSNTAFGRSGVAATTRLVGTGELTGYVQDPSSMSADLNAFTSSATVAATRNAVGADLMHLVVANTAGGACGVAWLGPSATYAHGVTARGCFAQYTFTHEAGHNFGNNHSLEDPVSSSPFRPYSFGYKNCGAASPFRTVMAYSCPGGGSRILNLSNPGVLHNGLVTGTTAQSNALSQSQAFPIVQAFRAGTTTAPPGVPQNLQASVAGSTITVSWQAPAQGDPVSTYVLSAGSGPGLSDLYNGAVGAVTAVSSPVPNGTYYIRVQAQNAAGAGPATADVVATVGVPPGPPQNVMASTSAGTITLSWTPPASGGAVSGYIVHAGTTSGSANVFSGAVGAATTVSGAVGAGTYYLRVQAQGPGGTSAPSAEVGIAVGPACTVPAAPVLTGGYSGGVIAIGWNTPAGGPVTGYTVRAGSASGLSNLYDAGVGLAQAVSAPVGPGLYFIRVTASAACGSSAESNELMIVVP